MACEQDPLLPPFDPEIGYICASKTNFVHGHKLLKEGRNKMYHENPGVLIKLRDDDVEGQQIQERAEQAS